jgi:cytoskeletal protein RodZ
MTGRDTPPSDTHGDRLKSFDDFELTLGDLMRGERATMGKSLLEVQRDIKIKAEYLAAIEDTDLSAFETPGFIGGYVKSYARYLGMNPDWVYRRFCDESGFSHVAGLDAQVYTTKAGRGTTKPVAVSKPVKRSDVGDAVLARSPIYIASSGGGGLAGVRAGAVGSLLVLCGMIAGLGYGGWRVLEEVQRVRVAPVETALTTAPQPATAVGGLVADNTVPTPEALERLYRPQALERPILTPRDAPIATLDPAGSGLYANYVPPLPQVLSQDLPDLALQLPSEDSPVGPRAALSPEVATVPPPRVALFAREAAWVRVRDSGGAVLFEGVLAAGDNYVLPDAAFAALDGTDAPTGATGAAAEGPTLRAGNSGGLYFAVEGGLYGPAGAPGTIVSGVALTPAALRDAYVAADLSADPEVAALIGPLVDPVPVSVAAALPDPGLVQVVAAPPSEVVLFARRPAWVRVSAADGTVLLEKILETGERYVLPATEQPPILRAGNSGSLFFAVNGQTIGPAGPGTTVAKNIELSAAALMQSYSAADLTEDPELARLAALVLEPRPPLQVD